MKKNRLILVAFFLSAFFLFIEKDSYAIPAFSRQTGQACNFCHYGFPELNAAGRDFKSSGYTAVGGQSLIEGEMLSIPATLNASLITKVRYQKTNGDTEAGDNSELSKGQLQFPDEAGVFLGGRAGGHAGFLIEISLKDNDSRFTSYKMPVIFNAADTNLSVIPFTTDNHGAAYGFELLNTGSLVAAMPLEHKKETSAQQYIGTATPATGLSFVASHPLWYANYTMWAPVHGTNATGPYLHYVRAAVTPRIRDFELGAGVQWWGGTSKTGPGANPVRTSADAWAADAELHGSAGKFPFGLFATYARSGKTNEGLVNAFDAAATKTKIAWTALGEVGVLPNRVALAAGYRGARSGDPNRSGQETDNAVTAAVKYYATQNLQLQLDHTWYMGDGKPGAAAGNNLTTLLLFGAF